MSQAGTWSHKRITSLYFPTAVTASHATPRALFRDSSLRVCTPNLTCDETAQESYNILDKSEKINNYHEILIDTPNSWVFPGRCERS